MAGQDLAQGGESPTYEWTRPSGSSLGLWHAVGAAVPCGCVRLRREEEHLRMLPRGCWVTVVPARPRGRSAGAQAGWRVFQRPGDRNLRLRHYGARTLIETGGICPLRHLPGPPDHGAGPVAPDLQDGNGHHGANHPVGSGHRPRQHHQPEPRFCGRQKTLPPNLRATHVSCLTARCRPGAHRRLAFCFQGTPKHRPARTISATCSTASDARMRWRRAVRNDRRSDHVFP